MDLHLINRRRHSCKAFRVLKRGETIFYFLCSAEQLPNHCRTDRLERISESLPMASCRLQYYLGRFLPLVRHVGGTARFPRFLCAVAPARIRHYMYLRMLYTITSILTREYCKSYTILRITSSFGFLLGENLRSACPAMATCQRLRKRSWCSQSPAGTS